MAHDVSMYLLLSISPAPNAISRAEPMQILRWLTATRQVADIDAAGAQRAVDALERESIQASPFMCDVGSKPNVRMAQPQCASHAAGALSCP